MELMYFLHQIMMTHTYVWREITICDTADWKIIHQTTKNNNGVEGVSGRYKGEQQQQLKVYHPPHQKCLQCNRKTERVVTRTYLEHTLHEGHPSTWSHGICTHSFHLPPSHRWQPAHNLSVCSHQCLPHQR